MAIIDTAILRYSNTYGYTVQEHVIIAAEGYYSYKKEGKLD